MYWLANDCGFLAFGMADQYHVRARRIVCRVFFGHVDVDVDEVGV
jgi:hypothetical protein